MEAYYELFEVAEVPVLPEDLQLLLKSIKDKWTTWWGLYFRIPADNKLRLHHLLTDPELGLMTVASYARNKHPEKTLYELLLQCRLDDMEFNEQDGKEHRDLPMFSQEESNLLAALHEQIFTDGTCLSGLTKYHQLVPPVTQ